MSEIYTEAEVSAIRERAEAAHGQDIAPVWRNADRWLATLDREQGKLVQSRRDFNQAVIRMRNAEARMDAAIQEQDAAIERLEPLARRCEAAEAERDRLAAENRALREAVGVVPEWIYGLNRKSPSHNSEWYCLFCSVSRTEHGHHPACPRQAALAPKEEDGTHG